MKNFTSPISYLKRVPDSTVRRLSLYLGFLEELEDSGEATVSSDVLARLGGTTSAQVRKDLSICLGEARRNGASLPVTGLVDQFYAQVEKMGGRRWDTSSLLALLER